MRRIDITPLRRFFMGVLGWTPETVMRRATLGDLKDALEGYAEHHGLAVKTVSKNFMRDMMTMFPDKENDHAQEQ